MPPGNPPPSWVADTVAIVFRLQNRPLGPQTALAFSQAEAGTGTVHIPALVFAEIMYLAEKGRITINLSDVFRFQNSFPGFQEYPLNGNVVVSASQITDVKDLHDRLIAGTAKALGLILLTKDQEILASHFVQTAW